MNRLFPTQREAEPSHDVDATLGPDERSASPQLLDRYRRASFRNARWNAIRTSSARCSTATVVAVVRWAGPTIIRERDTHIGAEEACMCAPAAARIALHYGLAIMIAGRDRKG
jgi:hypothetical protein